MRFGKRRFREDVRKLECNCGEQYRFRLNVEMPILEERIDKERRKYMREVFTHECRVCKNQVKVSRRYPYADSWEELKHGGS